MIYTTGDTHGAFLRFDPQYFPEQEQMARDDYVIICGDLGVYGGSPVDDENLDWLDARPFTTLFVDGNHENYDILNALPLEDWHGGRIHRVRPTVLHLTRGQVFELEGHTFFTMGGASSHDIEAGILNTENPDFEEKYQTLRRMRARFRVSYHSWWKEELPSDEEYIAARATLERFNWQVDYVVTHCAPQSIVDVLSHGGYLSDRLTYFLEEVNSKLKFHYWLFGHYHDNRIIGRHHVLLWEQVVRII